MRSGPYGSDIWSMPTTTAPIDGAPAFRLPAVLVHLDEDAAELQRRLEACLLIVRRISPTPSPSR